MIKPIFQCFLLRWRAPGEVSDSEARFKSIKFAEKNYRELVDRVNSRNLVRCELHIETTNTEPFLVERYEDA